MLFNFKQFETAFESKKERKKKFTLMFRFKQFTFIKSKKIILSFNENVQLKKKRLKMRWFFFFLVFIFCGKFGVLKAKWLKPHANTKLLLPFVHGTNHADFNGKLLHLHFFSMFLFYKRSSSKKKKKQNK